MKGVALGRRIDSAVQRNVKNFAWLAKKDGKKGGKMTLLLKKIAKIRNFVRGNAPWDEKKFLHPLFAPPHKATFATN